MVRKIFALFMCASAAFSLSSCDSLKGASPEEVKQGYINMQTGEKDSDEVKQVIEKYAQCVVDLAYNDLSISTRNAIAGAQKGSNNVGIALEDTDTMKKVDGVCSEKYSPELEKAYAHGVE
ncbi:MAG: hypothetical protein J6M18_00510 [Actinomycetaceae bacterium]|nr:hypothetical protein [Actinomycetaceae bacterium]